MRERHVIAAVFHKRTDAVDCVRDLETQGLKEDDIHVLMPPRESGEEFRAVGVEAAPAGGGDMLDRLASLFTGRSDVLADLDLPDQERDYLVDSARGGDYVVAVRCDGMCLNVRPILSRHGGVPSAAQTDGDTRQRKEVTPQMYETSDYREQPQSELQPRARTQRHAIAAAFTNKLDAVNAVRDLEAQGISEKDIRVLLPPGTQTGESWEKAGARPRVVGGGSILDQLTGLFQGGFGGLSDLGFEDREQKSLEEATRKGEYVVGVKCDGMCPTIHPILTRYGGREVFTQQKYEDSRYREQRPMQAGDADREEHPTQEQRRLKRASQKGAERRGVAAAFVSRTSALNAIRDLHELGITDEGIRVLLPSGAESDRSKEETGTRLRIVSGGSLLDQLTSLFQGGSGWLTDLGFSEYDQRALQHVLRRGEYVVCAKCETACADIDSVFFRWGGRKIATELFDETGSREEPAADEYYRGRTLREQPREYHGETGAREPYDEGREEHYA